MWNKIDENLSVRVSVSESISVPTGYGNVTSVSVNLTITNAYREDTGVYTCSANNSIGSDNKNVIITVQCKSILLSATFTLKQIIYQHYTLIKQSVGQVVSQIYTCIYIYSVI